MKLIIDAPDEIVKKGFEGPLTDEERQILIRAIGNGTSYEEPQGEHKIACNVLLSLEQIVRNSDSWEDSAVEAVHNAVQTAINCIRKRPQGEWIMQRHDLDGCFYTCSNCGRMIRVSLFVDDPEDNETLADYPFCHCGADMRGTK